MCLARRRDALAALGAEGFVNPGAGEGASAYLNAFLALGTTEGDSWTPCGGAVLLLDRPVVWLVTAREAIAAAGGRNLSTWVNNSGTADGAPAGPGLLDITDSQRQSGFDWIHHPTGLSATLFPLDARFGLKAFAETQCSRVRTLQPLQPTASVGCPYGVDTGTPHPMPAVCDGVISSVNQHSGIVLSTSPMLPNNVGAPLLLASPYGGDVSVAGILLGNALLTETDPRALPVRLGRAICIDAALELVRGADAEAQRNRVLPAPPTDTSNQENA